MNNNYEQKKLKRNEEVKKLKDYRKVLYNIDMVQGFVNFGPMKDSSYNDLVPEQLKIINEFRDENELVVFVGEGHDKNALEFKNYPEHCILGDPESDFIPEFQNQINLSNTKVYRKNCINGVLINQVREDIVEMKNLKEAIFVGVCEDLCVLDFARTYSRFLDQINKEVKLFVVANAVDTFDAPGHNREEWKKIARMVMEQAGIIYVDDYEQLKEKEKVLSLRKER